MKLLFSLLPVVFLALTACNDSSPKSAGGAGDVSNGGNGGTAGGANGAASVKTIDTESIRKGVFSMNKDLSFTNADDVVDNNGINTYTYTYSDNIKVNPNSLSSADAFCSVSITANRNINPSEFDVQTGEKLRLVTIQKVEDSKKSIAELKLAVYFSNPYLVSLIIDCKNVFSREDFNDQMGNLIEIHPEGTVLDTVDNQPEPLPEIEFKKEIGNYKFVAVSNPQISEGTVTRFESNGTSYYSIEVTMYLKNQDYLDASDLSSQDSYCEVSHSYRILVPPSSGELNAESLKSYYFFNTDEVEDGYNRVAVMRGPFGTADSVNYSLRLRYELNGTFSAGMIIKSSDGSQFITDEPGFRISCTNTLTVQEVNGHIGNLVQMSLK